MFKKFLKFIFPVFILLAFMSIDAKAVEEYPLWVGDQQVTSGNLSGAAGDGSWSFSGNSSGGTLTLNNATITDKHNMNFEDYPDWSQSHIANISCDTKNFDLTIQLLGNNTIGEDTSSNDDRGIYASQNTYTIKGPGSLNAKNRFAIGSYNGGLSITNGADITASNTRSMAIETSGPLVVSDSSVTATGSNVLQNIQCPSPSSSATFTNSNITLPKGIVCYGKITISDSTFTITSTKSRGIESEIGIDIINSTVNSKSKIKCTSSRSNGITILGNSSVTVDCDETDSNDAIKTSGGINNADQLIVLEPEGGRFSDDLTTVLNSDGSPAKKVVLTVKKYPIKFVNYDETELQSSEIAYGATPEYTGRIPTKPADDQYIYTFAGWDSEIVPVAGETTYTAVFSAEARTDNSETEGDPDDVTPISDDEEEEKAAQETDIDAPKTGDKINSLLWLSLAAISFIGLVFIMPFGKSYRLNNK